MTFPGELGVVSVMAAPFLAAWLHLATSSFSQIRGRQPYSVVRNIPYVIYCTGEYSMGGQLWEVCTLSK